MAAENYKNDDEKAKSATCERIGKSHFFLC